MSYEALQLALFTNDIERVGPIEKIVSPLGWRLVAAVMQKQPVQWILEQEVELMLLDLDMPNSIHLISSLNRCRPTVPVLAITSDKSIDKVHDALEMGAKDFITYPINPKRLMAALHSAIGERSTTVSNIIPIFDDEPISPKPQNGQTKSVKTAASPMHRQTVNTIDELADRFTSDEVEIEELADRFTSSAVEVEADSAEVESTIVEVVEAESALVQNSSEAISSKIDDTQNVSPAQHVIENQSQPVQSQPVQSQPIQSQPAQSQPVQSPPAQSQPVQSVSLKSQAGQMQQKAAAPQIDVPELEAPSIEQMDMHRRMPPNKSQRIEIPVGLEESNTNQNAALRAEAAVPKAKDTPPMQFQPAAGLTTSLPSVGGKTTAVVSLRGGVGRSTIATNLAVAIAQKGVGNVTLVEAHHGLSNLSLMLHLHPQRTLSTLESEHTIDHDIVRGYLQQHTSGVNVLSAPTEIDDMVELAPETWSHLLEIIAGLAHHTIIDTSSSADSALTEVLLNADDILVVTDPDIASLRSATALYKNIKSEPSIGGQLHVVINRSGVNGGLDEKTIQKQMGQEAVISLPFDPALATYAMNRGIPFVQSHPRALLTKRVLELAEKVFEPVMVPDLQNGIKKPATKSFMSFLGRS